MLGIPIGWFGIPGGFEWIIILVIALLIFGKRLPGTMRSIGKGFVEFKKGLKGVKDEVDEAEEEVKKIDDEDVDVK
ncbi:MAG: Sec-independent protein translocase protein TatA [Candidatus Scalindua arabica]|uniref:Sec-independent protein translocase protein TatA n=1 Tax=Candidatus Scalindua arabica TaxID=1127984 RepID=A0A942A385_9BACT|nr:Sec-independent protein translocase protein TatA [Candidatus Scalindua arabica]